MAKIATIAQYLTELERQRDNLAANLVTMGVSAAASEKLNTLVPKVLQIPQSGGTQPVKTILFDSDNRNNIYLQNGDTVSGIADFTMQYPDFCSEANGYALNYDPVLLGWDSQIFTCCTTPISITETSQIAMRFLSGSTEAGIMRLVQSDTGTAADILAKAQTEGSYTGLSMQWIYASDYVTTLTPCEVVQAGTYYLAWVGRSNNSHPLIKSIAVL